MPPEWKATPAGLSLSLSTADGCTVEFSAKLIRQERTGVHARLSLALNDDVLAWTNGNVEKDDERVRLRNSFYLKLSAHTAAAYSKEQCKQDLDDFCGELWERWIGQAMPEELAGAEVREAVTFALEPYVVQGGGTIMFAPPGAGKSYLGLMMAVSIDAGVTKVWPVKQQKVLYLNLERADKSFSQRLGNVNAVLGLPRNRPLRMLNARGRTLTSVADGARKYVQEQGIGVTLLDSISRAGFGKLVDDEVGNTIMDSLNGLCPSWLAIAHTPRADKSHAFGSQMFDAAADLLVQVTSQRNGDDNVLGVSMKITKDNDVGRRQPTMLALEFDRAGLVGVRPARPFEFPELIDAKQNTQQEVIEYLKDKGKADASELATALDVSRNRVVQILADHSIFVGLPREGKKKPYGLKTKETTF
mgnify:FL=1